MKGNTNSLSFFIHNRLKLFEMAKLDLKLFHLRFNKQSNETLYLALFNRREVLQETQI
jgi:hypothetical protein